MIYNNICEWYKIWNGKPINSELVNPHNFIEKNGRIYFLQHEAALYGKKYYVPNEDGIDSHFVVGYFDSYNGELKIIDRFEDEYLAQVDHTIGQHAPIFRVDEYMDRISFLSPVVEAGDEEKIWDLEETDVLRIKCRDFFDNFNQIFPGWYYEYSIPKKEDEYVAFLFEDKSGCKRIFLRFNTVSKKLELLCLFIELDNRIDVIGEMDLFLGYNHKYAYYMYKNQIYCIDIQENVVDTKVLDYSSLCNEHQCRKLAFYDVNTETAYFYMDDASTGTMDSLLGKAGLIGFDSNNKIQLVEQIPLMNNQDASIIFDGTKYVERVSGDRNGYIIYRKNGTIQEIFISNSAKVSVDNIFTVGNVVFLDWYDEMNDSLALAYSSVNGLHLIFQEDPMHDLAREYKSELKDNISLEVLDKSEIDDLKCKNIEKISKKALNFITVMNGYDYPWMYQNFTQNQQVFYELKDRIERKIQANNLTLGEMIGYAGCLELPDEVIDEFYNGKIHLDFDSIIREGLDGVETCKVGQIISCNENYIYSYCDGSVYRTDIESFERFHIGQLIPEIKDRQILFVDAAREIFYYANNDGDISDSFKTADIIGVDIYGNKVIAFEAAGLDDDLCMEWDENMDFEENIRKRIDAMVTLVFDGEKYIKLWMDHYSIL